MHVHILSGSLHALHVAVRYCAVLASVHGNLRDSERSTFIVSVFSGACIGPLVKYYTLNIT